MVRVHADPAQLAGVTTRIDLHAATRGPGQPFHAPVVVQSDNDLEAGYSGNNDIAVGGDGRVLIGYFTRVSRQSSPCSVTLGDAKTMVAAATIQPDGSATFAPKVMAGGGDVNSYIPRVAVGSDGRAAATWVGFRGCESNESSTAVPGAAFAPPYTGPGAVADPPSLGADPGRAAVPRAASRSAATGSWWRSWPTTHRATGVLLVGVRHGRRRRADPDPHTLTVAVPEPVALAHPDPAGARRERVREQGQGGKNGTLTLTVKAPAAGRVTVVALVKKKQAAKASKSVTAARSVKLTLKPKGKFKKQLRKKGKLKVTLRTTFKPASGAAPKATTRKATFKRQKRR